MDFIKKINEVVSSKEEIINSWLHMKQKEVSVPFYTSVDLRVSSNKIAAVDTNIFPAGFNNLSEPFINRASDLIKDYREKDKKLKIKKVLIIPEFHTRNPFYWDNVLALIRILEKSGLEVKIGLIQNDPYFEYEFKSSSETTVLAQTIQRSNNKVFVPGFYPDLVLINNDFSDSSPEILKGLSQSVVPPTEVGWHSRKKNIHFEFYNKLVEEFSELVSLDPSFFSLTTKLVEDINFDIIEDRERLADLSDKMISKLRRFFNIKDPSLFIKNDTGTYGMAVMQIDKGADILDLNRDGRKKMKVSKGGHLLKNVIIQEGIETIYSNKEPVYYLINCNVAGGFYRINDSRNSYQNLNTKGMYFKCLCLKNECSNCNEFFNPALEVVSKIGSLATGYEIEYLLKKNQSSDESSIKALL
ncbi:glutamate--cysteine ligase [bacterium]|jgi:glutamate--cysteine ligase|nr:glutamate--cysteine ligase [bacterium]MBT3850320.1 glutamate--cysteine ligase [bacterium]MBT4634028.1 glutamate--cysteine ligase [bacterium]